jgi:capsular exopolysaccharide synthesis family protein
VDEETIASAREEYRRLAATLHDSQTAKGLKVVMVASAIAGEGKTLTAINLALTLSESYRRRVLLLDGDLRTPGLHTIFNVDNSTGLSEALTAPLEQSLRVQHVSATLAVLPAGYPLPDPMAGLSSERMRRVIADARETFDWVIVDTPAIALVPDANLLTSMVDAAILVVRAESTPHDLVQRAIDTIGRVRTLGVVLNCANAGPAGYSYSRYEQYGRHQPAS